MASGIAGLLDELAARGIVLAAEGDKLTLKGPRGALTPELREAVAAHKPALLARCQASPAGPLPLSPGQERIYFLQRLSPESASYNVAIAMGLTGPLDARALLLALDSVILRHQPLRASFTEIDGRPAQLVAPPRPAAITPEIIDLRGRPGMAEEIAAAHAERPFDLTSGPLLRAALLRLADDRHRLLLTLHHIVFDALSTRVLTEELAHNYAAFIAGRLPTLPALPLQYSDFVAQERSRAEGPEVRRHLDHWRRRLASPPPPLPPSLSLDPERRGAIRVGLDIEADRAARIDAFCRSEGATRFMVLLAVFSLLLARRSGGGDITVGIPWSGRNRPELEGLIGFFVDTLVIRLALAPDLSFRDLLAQARDTSLEAHAHAGVPLDRLVADIAPGRRGGEAPLYQAMLNVVRLADERPALPGLEVDLSETMPGARADLTLYALDRPGSLRIELASAPHLMDRAGAEEALAQIASILSQALDHPDQKIATFSLVTSRFPRVVPDPSQPLHPSAYPPVHQIFVAMARRSPDRIAVACSGRCWSYGEVLERSLAVAGRLRAMGVEPGDRVAIQARRVPALIWTLIGVMRAGAAFVILDASHPPAWNAERIRVAAPAAVLDLDLSSDPSPPVPEVPVDPDDLAYLAFTSGTTGAPRAVEGPHCPLSHFLDWYRRAFTLTEVDRFVVLSGLSHDPLLRDVFTPLTLGATLVIPGEGDLSDLSELLRREAITVAHLTPAIGRMLRGPLPDLRLVCSGGDVLTGRDIDALRAAAHQATLVNVYGATETPQAIAYHVVTGTPPRAPVGRGIEGVDLLVLGQAGLAGVGELGEIAVRTPYLARGYAGDPEATRARFLPSPFRDDPTDRMYLTGDLGRFLPDGGVEIAGRRDAQIKVLGVRVDPGEVEAALLSHPGVRAAAVAAFEVSPGDLRLAAWISGEATPSEVSAFARTRLPEALQPVSITALPALPLTSHGKVDRSSLPPPSLAPPALEVPPTALQDAVAVAWTEVLGASPGDARRSFFELGGHSLLAARLVARIRQATSVDLPLAAIFEAPTLAGLTDRVQAALEGGAVPPPTPVCHRGSLLASFAQRRLWFLDQLSPQDPAYRITGALHLQGPLDLASLDRAMVEVERRHEVLRTTYALVDGEVVQRVGEARDAVLEVVDLGHLSEEARRRAVIERLQEDARRPFDLARGPIFRAALLELSTEEHVLAVAVHHIASDGWSMRLLRGEISALYQGRALPPLPLQYADYAAWQRAEASSDRAERHLAYWRARLAGLPTLDLPLSRPRPRTRQGRGAQCARVIEGPLLVALRDLGRARGVTVFMTLLGALSLVLSRWTGGVDIPVGAPLGYRTEPSTFGIIGLFVHLAVLRIDLGGAPTFAALLQRAREAVLGAYAHRDLPFEQLVEALTPERDPSRTPLFQVFLNMQHATLDDTASLGDLRTERMPRPEPAANFDLTVRAIESDHGLELAVVYAVDVLEQAQAEALLDHLLAALSAGVASPDSPIDAIALPRPWPPDRGITPSGLDRETTLGARFLRQAEQSGDRIAVDTGGNKTSYAALAARAKGAAGALRGVPLRGAPPRVGLLFDHDAAMVAGLLGALLAGATYVPLDPGLPDDRLAFMAADAGVSAILTQVGGRARARRIAPSGAAIVDLDEGPALPAALGGPGDEAYILYTSGSTGRPKGVVQSHRNALHHALTYARSLAITAEDRLSLLSTYAFDAALMDLFGALLSGATLCPLDLRAALADLGPAVDALQVSVLHATPTVFRRLVETLPPGRILGGVRRVVLGGEEARRADVEAFERHFPEGCLLVNGLGPTESTLALQHFVRRGDPLPRASVPVGRPVEGVEVDLEASGRSVVVPYGVGEIVLRSDFVALGYHGRPELTAAAFSTGPDGRRAYRTGDLGRRLPDGAIEYAGRRDGQVKIRGHRVEIGEIEATLEEHPEVGDAAVVVKERAPGDICLAAWVTPRPGAEAPSPRAVSSFLRARLPGVMIPAAVSVIVALPLGPTGKIDRRALADPSLEPASSASPAEAPRDPLEASLALVWEEVLDVHPVGVHDSFFDLGGHSLLAVRLLGKIQERLGRAVPLASLFEGATVAHLAALLRDGAPPRMAPARLVPMRAQGRLRPFVCLTPPGGSAWAHFTDLLAQLDRERPFYALEPPSFGTTGGSLQEAAARCRAALTLPGPHILGGYSLGGAIAYELACQLEGEGVEVASLVLLDTPAPPLTQARRPAGEVDLRAFARYLARHVAEPYLGGRRAEDLPVTEGDLGAGDLDTRLARLVDRGRCAGVLSPSTQVAAVREALDYYQAQRRAHARALEGWSPGRYRAPLAVIRATKSRLDRRSVGARAPALGWGSLAGGLITEHVAPGDHDTMLDLPAVVTLAGALERWLNEAGTVGRGAPPGERPRIEGP